MGNPAENMEVGVADTTNFDRKLLQFCGYPFKERDEIFQDKELTLKVPTKTGTGKEVFLTFNDAKWRSPNIVQVLLNLDEYFILLNFVYSEEKKSFVFKDAHELYYGSTFKLLEEQDYFTKIFTPLNVWRQEQILKEKRCNKYDIINTTHFHAKLECEYYEPFKPNYYCDSHRIGSNPCESRHPNPYCDKHDPYVHIATYHIEPEYVPPLPPPAVEYPDFFSTYNWKFDQNCCCKEEPKPTYKRKDFE